MLRRHEEATSAADTDDALFGAYLKKLHELKASSTPTVASSSSSPSPTLTPTPTNDGGMKATMQYKITFVGYAEGEHFRAIYQRMETAAKEFGHADAFEFWDKKKVLNHHGTNSSVLAGLYETSGPNAAWAWKPAGKGDAGGGCIAIGALLSCTRSFAHVAYHTLVFIKTIHLSDALKAQRNAKLCEHDVVRTWPRRAFERLSV